MLRLFNKHKLLFLFTILLSTATSVLTIVAAYLLEDILNAVVAGNWTQFTNQSWLVLGYFAILTVVISFSVLAEKRLIMQMVKDLRADIHNGILSRDAEQYHQNNSADYLSALTNDIKIIEENLLVPFLNAIQYAIVFVMAAVALFVYSPLIGAAMIVCLFLMYLLPSSLGRPIGKNQELYSKGLSLFTLRLKDQLLGYEVIRSYHLTDKIKAAFADQNQLLANHKYSVDKLLALSEGIAQIIGAASQIGTMLLAGYLVLKGEMAAGSLLAIMQLAGAFVQPVAVIMQSIPMIQGAQPIMKKLNELSSHTPSAFHGNAAPAFEKEICFEEIDFGYTKEHPVLCGLKATFEKGKKYVIAGESGCGKSTLMKLLGAEFSSYSGSVRIDGKELHELDTNQLLTKISTIHQNVYMFDESIKDNIDLHRSYTEQDWHRALQLSGVSKFLGQTEHGINSPVGEGGTNLSGGQRQRIAVARALIEKKPILILDEGTSAVDVQTAYDIEHALLEINDLTMITITHSFRPELLHRYDAILYMEKGRIVECGSYKQLMEQNGKFASFQRIEQAAS